MRSWLHAAGAAAVHVADRPALWLPGALGWLATVGWIPLLAGVIQAPTTAELTFTGAGVFSSGLWPWNAIALGVATLVLVAVVALLSAFGDAALLRGLERRREASGSDVLRLMAVGLVAVTPMLAALVAAGIASVVIGPEEFNAPDDGGSPLLRIGVRLAPYLVAALVFAAAGSGWSAAAARRALARGDVRDALAGGARTLAVGAPASIVQPVAATLAGLAYVVVGAVLLRVLWTPIALQLESGIDAGPLVLLVGFVAIWLCLVLGGGALRAWSSATWNRLLAAEDARDRQPLRERPIDR